jgi:hypothetical protein
MKRFVIAATTTIVLLAGSRVAAADEQFGQCERLQYSFEPLRRGSDVTLRLSSQGNSAGDASWPSNVLTTYAAAAAGWTSMRPASNPGVAIGTTQPTVTAGYSGIGDFEIVQRYSNFTSLGTTQDYHVWPGWDIQHTDMRIFGPTVSDPVCGITGTPGCLPLTHTTSCALGIASEGGTVLHELGHAYGFDHQDDVLSMMASAQIDVLSCALGDAGPVTQRLIPDANGHLCMREAYDLFEDYEIGISPVTPTPGCNPRASTCYRVAVPVVGGVLLVSTASATSVPITYTVFNNGAPIMGPLDVEVSLSTDTTSDAADVVVAYDIVGDGDGFVWGDTRVQRSIISIDPDEIAELTPGVPMRVLLRVDAGVVFPSLPERDEANNITDLRFTVVRT